MKGSKSVSDPKDEEEIKVQYVKPIRGIPYHLSIQKKLVDTNPLKKKE